MMISIIVPVYNVEKYIDRCIESLLAQTYSDFEIVLIDDGSTDLSGEKCDIWSGIDNRIRVFHQQNKGHAVVRNKGLSEARGKYIAWVDSDDYVDSHYLESLLKTLETTNADMVMCSFYTDIDGTIEHVGKERFHAEVIDKQCFLERVYTYGLYSVLWNKIALKETYKNVVFPEGRMFEDSAIMRQLASLCNKVVIIEEPLYYYRRHATSIMLKKRNEKEKEKYLEHFCQWISEDIEVYQKEGNTKLVDLASRHLCDAIIQYSEGLSKALLKSWKNTYRRYERTVLSSKYVSCGAKMKYLVARFSFSWCRFLERKLFFEKRKR